MKKKPPIIIITDSREQKPFQFENSIVKALPTGDYSVLGLEDKIAIERKSKQDIYSSFGAERERFEKELQRMAKLDYAAIVIESGLPDLLQPPPFSQMNPRSVINSLLSWSIKYRVHIFFAGDRRHAKALTYRILEKYHKFWEKFQEQQKNEKG